MLSDGNLGGTQDPGTEVCKGSQKEREGSRKNPIIIAGLTAQAFEDFMDWFNHTSVLLPFNII
jgi:hypothetical protein